MRKLIFVLGLAMLAAVCLGTASEPPKPEKPKAAPPEPLVEPQTGITFPVRLGQMTLRGSHRYDTPELGVSVNYQAAGQVFISADIYIYDLGKKNLGEGTGSDLVKSHFKQCQDDILTLEKRGRYKDVRKAAQVPIALKIGDKALPMLSAVYEFSVNPDAGKPGEPQPAVSHLMLTAYKDKFFKIRCTYAAAVKDKGGVILEGFLAALGDALKDRAPTVLARSAAPAPEAWRK